MALLKKRLLEKVQLNKSLPADDHRQTLEMDVEYAEARCLGAMNSAMVARRLQKALRSKKLEMRLGWA